MNNNTPTSLLKLNQVHRANIEKKLAHRLESARAKGNQDLIKVLETERQLLQWQTHTLNWCYSMGFSLKSPATPPTPRALRTQCHSALFFIFVPGFYITLHYCNMAVGKIWGFFWIILWGLFYHKLRIKKAQNNIVNQCPIESHWLTVDSSQVKSKIMGWGFSTI